MEIRKITKKVIKKKIKWFNFLKSKQIISQGVINLDFHAYNLNLFFSIAFTCYPVISFYQDRCYIALSNPQEQLILTISPFMFIPPAPKMAVIRSGSSVQCVSVWVMTLSKSKTIAVVRLHSWTPPQHTHCLYVEFFTHIQTHASKTSFMAVSQITTAHFQHMRNNFRIVFKYDDFWSSSSSFREVYCIVPLVFWELLTKGFSTNRIFEEN